MGWCTFGQADNSGGRDARECCTPHAPPPTDHRLPADLRDTDGQRERRPWAYLAQVPAVCLPCQSQTVEKLTEEPDAGHPVHIVLSRLSKTSSVRARSPSDLTEAIERCASGRELAAMGSPEEPRIATALDADDHASVMEGGMFVRS